MKEMKKIAEGKNFTACDFGKLNDLGGYVLQLGDIKIPGKVFGGQAVGAPPRVEYALTERGESLMPLLNQLVNWSVENMSGIMTSRKRYADNNNAK